MNKTNVAANALSQFLQKNQDDQKEFKQKIAEFFIIFKIY